MLDLGGFLAESGFKCLLHDRRNTEAADIGFGDGSKAEHDLQVEDTLHLLKHLDMSPAIFVGNSSGSRLSLLCALEEPSAVTALALMNMTGGKQAAKMLAHEYHLRYVKLLNRGGVEALANDNHYIDMVEQNPDNREKLRNLDPEVVRKVLESSGEFLKRAPADFKMVNPAGSSANL
eukprot:gene1170-biopygen1000